MTLTPRAAGGGIQRRPLHMITENSCKSQMLPVPILVWPQTDLFPFHSLLARISKHEAAVLSSLWAADVRKLLAVLDLVQPHTWLLRTADG